MSQIPDEPELSDVESALRSLVPGPARLDRDRLMFEAGALSRRPKAWRRWAWPSAAAILAAVAGGETVLLATRPAPTVIERLVLVPDPSGAGQGPRPPAPSSPNHDEGPSGPIAGSFVPGGLALEVASSAFSTTGKTVADYRREQYLSARLGLEFPPEPVGYGGRPGPSIGMEEAAAHSVGELRRRRVEEF